MKNEILQNPSLEESFDLLKRDNPETFFHNRQRIRARSMIVSFGYCQVDYEGRASSSLDFGDRLVILKKDGTALIHQNEKREPVNWQPPGSSHEAILKVEGEEPTDLILRSVRSNPFEVLDIAFREIHLLSILKGEDEAQLNLSGSEKSMGNRIMKQPDLIEQGFIPIEREKKTPFGPVDIFGKDYEGNIVVVELKRRRVGPDAVSQLKRYINALRKEESETKGENFRGILVAPSITDSAKDLLEEEGLEFVSLNP